MAKAQNSRPAPEFDSCAVYAAVLKNPGRYTGVPLWHRALEALGAMEHRSGQLDGKSDGTGIITSFPESLWRQRLPGLDERTRGKLWILTLAISLTEERQAFEALKGVAGEGRFSVVGTHWDVVDGGEGLWTAALLHQSAEENLREWKTLERLEEAFPGQIAAWGQHLTSLKMRVDAQTLAEHAYKLWGEHFQPRVVVGHNRFSTNTTTELRRVQPFLWLAHNGEINTIGRVRDELASLGINSVEQGSDSQSLDRVLMQMSRRYGLSLAETMRLISAPSPAVVKTWPSEWQDAYARLETFWSPVVQGPQALVATDGQQLVAAVDAMGLRPLWILETDDAIILSSEPGVVPPKHWRAEPRMIGAGEIVAWNWSGDGPLTRVNSEHVTEALLARVKESSWPQTLSLAEGQGVSASVPEWQRAADGWTRDDLQMVKAWTTTGQEPIGSLGFDGLLAALSTGGVTITDYLQETVAVVTNPALDREREAEHFRLSTWLGPRPHGLDVPVRGPVVRLQHPWLTDAGLAQVAQVFGVGAQTIAMSWTAGSTELERARELGRDVVERVRGGVHLIILDDAGTYQPGQSVSLDPALALAAVERAVTEKGLGRSVSLVVRSGMIRNLHDAAVLMGLGAAALVPYAIWAAADSPPIEVLNHGLEKIFSTMGTHWLSGYGRNFSAIGLPQEAAELMGVPTWAAPTLENWERRRESVRAERLQAVDSGARPRFIPHFNPHVYKPAQQLTRGAIDAEAFHESIGDLERKMPSQLRHVLLVSRHDAHVVPSASLTVGNHDYPFVISSMSFGSQGESAFRAYAEAAKRLNIVAMNGEGGEIPDMIGRYTRWRGYQVASGRFGINSGLLNGAAYVEIKIGQGAKPGEGGHLPGRKVSEKVARARNARPGTDLISPSNNHDLYSIEDLRQLIDELKTVNPELKVVVKVPVVPNIGTIAVGIVKAGADVITLSGFDGGTGAARSHALRHVGLPAEVGVPLTHHALVQAGVRDQVELWADGGVRTADDVLKLILMGANRVGFGTMAMVALGCTICRQCQKDTCHVGITTQIETVEEAHKRGIKRFVPQEVELATNNLVAFFQAVGSALEERLRHLGMAHVSDAVGQWHLLRQWGAQESLDFVSWMASLVEDDQELLVSEVNGPEVVVRSSASATRVPPVFFQPVDRRMAGVWQSGRRTGFRSDREEIIEVHGVAGQGFGAFLSDGITCSAWGGAQDGVGKAASGGIIRLMKHGRFGGHAGKSLAYGAQGGTIVVQGAADSRAGVRLAGGRIVIMGEGLPSVRESTSWWDSAAIKGFGFEYMTRGQALVLADPGPWIAAGMTGGVIYLRHDPDTGLTREYLQSRVSSSARVELQSLGPDDGPVVRELLEEAARTAEESGHGERANVIRRLGNRPEETFLKVVAASEQMDQEVSTE